MIHIILKSFGYLNINGKGTLINQYGKKINFSVPIEEYFYIEDLFYSDYNGSILLVCELSDADAGFGKVVLLDSLSFKVKWQNQLPSFNIGEPLLNNHYLYLSSIGWVGKLDVVNGEYVWQIDNLYVSGIYNSFKKPFFPLEYENIIVFPEQDSFMYPDRKIPFQTLKVDDNTGDIISGDSRINYK
jgi:hypothetical protein